MTHFDGFRDKPAIRSARANTGNIFNRPDMLPKAPPMSSAQAHTQASSLLGRSAQILRRKGSIAVAKSEPESGQP